MNKTLKQPRKFRHKQGSEDQLKLDLDAVLDDHSTPWDLRRLIRDAIAYIGYLEHRHTRKNKKNIGGTDAEIVAYVSNKMQNGMSKTAAVDDAREHFNYSDASPVWKKLARDSAYVKYGLPRPHL